MSQRDYQMEKEVNKWLADYFPHYRLVWGPEQKEFRHGTFVKNFPIYSQVTETREVVKYSWLIPCYVLETRAIMLDDSEVKNHNGWDVCLPFIGINQKAVMPDLESVQFMMKEMVSHDGKMETTEPIARQKDAEKFDKDVEKIEQSLEG